MTKVAFYESTRSESERSKFQEQVQGLKIPFHHDFGTLSTDLPQVLFFHGGDQADLKVKDELGHVAGLKPGLAEVWLIEFGGNDTGNKRLNNEAALLSNKAISYINYSDLSERLKEIIDQINALAEITTDNLENIIFAIDPDIEKLLAELCTKSPFAESWDPDSRNKRKNLIDLINQKHGMTLK